MAREIRDEYDVLSTVEYIARHRFSVVALEFPDELLKASVAVTGALRQELGRAVGVDGWQGGNVKLFVMADTTYGSCCADEVAAAHVNAECIIHYGHACHSLTSRLPVFHVYGKSELDAENCATRLWSMVTDNGRPLLVLFGLEYSHALPHLKQTIAEKVAAFGGTMAEVRFAEVVDRETKPVDRSCEKVTQAGLGNDGCEASTCSKLDTQRIESSAGATISGRCLGGLRWYLPDDGCMNDFEIFWIGGEGPALTNIMLTHNSTTVVRYDPVMKLLHTDVASQSRTLKRRYYLVELAKDANIVGILVGTLGVAGYERAIESLRKMISASHKKSYVLLMGKPNPAKLANFPECDVFVHVACAQTALLDSKEYLAPLITPFEAQLAFIRGSQWTGAYSLDFQSFLDDFVPREESPEEAEPRFSFVKGQYVEDNASPELTVAEGDSLSALVLSKAAKRALQLSPTTDAKSLGLIKTSAEYLALRSYQGLEVRRSVEKGPDAAAGIVIGRKGRAAGYSDEAY